MKTIVSVFVSIFFFSFNSFAQNTYVPDDNFEQALIDLGYDTVLDDYVLTANIAGVTTLNVDQKNISDMTGIEDFAALITLNCVDNQIDTLDISQNSSLEGLYCHYNELTTLDVTQNTALISLNCRSNQLNVLDVTQNTALLQLSCNSNQLFSLDISQNTALTYLNCSINQLNSLDVSVNTSITQLFCNLNQLSTLDVSQNTALINLFCNNNLISSLDLTQNTAIGRLIAHTNQLNSMDIRNGNNTNIVDADFQTGSNPNLTCIFVDDAAWSSANWSNIDPNSTFVETQIACDALSLNEEIINQSIFLYPNPANDIIAIHSDSTISSIVFYDILGKIVRRHFTNEIDISALSKGIYLIQITTDDGKISTLKLLKE